MNVDSEGSVSENSFSVAPAVSEPGSSAASDDVALWTPLVVSTVVVMGTDMLEVGVTSGECLVLTHVWVRQN